MPMQVTVSEYVFDTYAPCWLAACLLALRLAGRGLCTCRYNYRHSYEGYCALVLIGLIALMHVFTGVHAPVAVLLLWLVCMDMAALVLGGTTVQADVSGVLAAFFLYKLNFQSR